MKKILLIIIGLLIINNSVVVVKAQSYNGIIFDMIDELKSGAYENYIDEGKINNDVTGLGNSIEWKMITSVVGARLRGDKSFGSCNYSDIKSTQYPYIVVWPVVYLENRNMTNRVIDEGVVLIEGDKLIINIDIEKTGMTRINANSKFTINLRIKDKTDKKLSTYMDWSLPGLKNMLFEYEIDKNDVLDSEYILLKNILICNDGATDRLNGNAVCDDWRIRDIKVGINNMIPPEKIIGEYDYKIYFTSVVKRWFALYQNWQYTLHGYCATMDGTKLVPGIFYIKQEMGKKFLIKDNQSFKYRIADGLFEWEGKSKNSYDYLDITFIPDDNNYKTAVMRISLSEIENIWNESFPLEIDTFSDPDIFTEEDYREHIEENYMSDEFWTLIENMLIDNTKNPVKKTTQEWLDDAAERSAETLLGRIINIILTPFKMVSVFFASVTELTMSLMEDAGGLFEVWTRFFAWCPVEIKSIFSIGASLVVILRILGR